MRSRLAVLMLGVVIASGSAVVAQQGGGNDGGGGRGGARMDAGQWRERIETRMKEQMGVSDEEWKVLQPKIQKVTEARMQGMGGMGMGMGMGRGRGAGGGGGDAATSRPASPVAEKARELTTVLENKEAKPEEIKAKLDALRTAREKAREDLKKAQTELKELLTVRQEAVLVGMGLLE